jgi:hypothetical protein
MKAFLNYPGAKWGMTQNDCIYFDHELGCCKILSDWGQRMPVLQPCIESPCECYKKSKEYNQ